MKKKNIGSSFDDWLHEEGFYEEATAAAIQRVLVRKISQERG
jgi:antitoxin HicB